MICIKKDNIISNKTNLLEEEICVKKFHHQVFFYSLNITPKTFLLIPNRFISIQSSSIRKVRMH